MTDTSLVERLEKIIQMNCSPLTLDELKTLREAERELEELQGQVNFWQLAANHANEATSEMEHQLENVKQSSCPVCSGQGCKACDGTGLDPTGHGVSADERNRDEIAKNG